LSDATTSCPSDAVPDVTDDVKGGGGCYSPLKPPYFINAFHQPRLPATDTHCWSPVIDFDANDTEDTAAGDENVAVNIVFEKLTCQQIKKNI